MTSNFANQSTGKRSVFLTSDKYGTILTAGLNLDAVCAATTDLGCLISLRENKTGDSGYLNRRYRDQLRGFRQPQ